MWPLLVVINKPLIEVCLKKFYIIVQLLAESDCIEFLLHGPVQTFTDAIALWMPHFGFTVINTFDL